MREFGGDEFTVESVGVASSKVRREAVEAMREIGIDISLQRSKSIEEFAGQNFNFIITVCYNAKEISPVFPGSAARIHWSFTDPPPEIVGDDEARPKIFREVRDQLREWLNNFVRSGKNQTANQYETTRKD